MAYLYARDAHARFVAAFNFLSASKNVKLDDAKLEASFLVLGDLPIESVETAATALAREGTHWMPSDGEWYEVADTDAARSLVLSADHDVAQLTAAGHIEADEIASLTAARRSFVAAYELASGGTLPPDHVWKTDRDHVPAYHCATCGDTGWRDHTCSTDDQCHACIARGRHLYDHTYLQRCVCFETNAALLAARAHATQGHRLRRNIRGEGRR
jgi:hypothetical protein